VMRAQIGSAKERIDLEAVRATNVGALLSTSEQAAREVLRPLAMMEGAAAAPAPAPSAAVPAPAAAPAAAAVDDWPVADDFLLREAVEAGAALGAVARGILPFSVPYTREQITARWR